MQTNTRNRLFLLALLAGTVSNSPARQQDEQTAILRENEGRAFVKLMAARRFEECVALFDSTMKAVMPTPKVEEAWNAVEKQAGKFMEQQSVRHQRYGVYDIVFVTCRFEGIPLDVRVVFNQAGKIAGLFFAPPQPTVEYALPPYVRRDVFR